MKTVAEVQAWSWFDLHDTWRHHFPKADVADLPTVAFFEQGNFTICEVCVAPDLRAFGVTKRNPKLDRRHRPEVAHKASFGRACKALAAELQREEMCRVNAALGALGGGYADIVKQS